MGTKRPCPIDPTEQEVIDTVRAYKRTEYTRGPVSVERTGREHVFDLRNPWALGGLRYLPDLLLTGRANDKNWSIFLECKNSSKPEGFCVKVEALEAYRQIQTLSGNRVYVVTTTQGWVGFRQSSSGERLLTYDNRDAEEFQLRGELVVAPVNKLLEANYAVNSSRRGRDWPYFGEERYPTDPYVVIPRAAFTWPLHDLLAQMESGKRLPRPPAAEVAA